MKSLIYISITLLLFSCTKGGGNIYFSGRVYNPISNEGIPNVSIKLIQKTLTGGDILSGSSKVRGEVVTNSNGEFEMIETVAGKNLRYLIEYDENKYQLIGWDIAGNNGKPVLKGEDDYDNLKMVPFGRSSFHQKNINCIEDTDSASFVITYLLTNVSTGFNSFRTGCYDENYLSSQMKAVGDYRADWYVIRNGVRTDSSKVFTIYENDTTHVELFY